MPTDLIAILCTCPDTACGASIAKALIDERLAACANLLPGVRSFYRWDGAVQDDSETLLVIKTTAARFNAVEALVRKNHPYDLPELVALPIVAGSTAYLDWVRGEVS
ncbi:MAG TPA: divalent-cation tolerance protein CutA [Gammaproteobacteria bacterium]|nr:divalent-cation tolerance protein CutA [Gammaproteobacteria bacterium]